MLTLYEAVYYVLVIKTKLCYGMDLVFYDIEDKDLSLLLIYENQTVRYKGQWGTVKKYKKYLNTADEQKIYPENWIKYPYKKMIPIKTKG